MKRPAVPAEIARQVLIESGHRCAVCGESCSLEKAHIIPWHKSKQHRAEDLICLCANCHTRSHTEKWDQETLRTYKNNPWVLRSKDVHRTEAHEMQMRPDPGPSTALAIAAPVNGLAPFPFPPRPTYCFGRDDLLEVVIQHILARSPLPIPLLGPAGVGKSTIALAVLHDPRIAAQFRNRRFFVPCDAAISCPALVGEINRTLGIQDANPQPALLRFLGLAPTILVLDNVDMPWQQPDATLAVEELLTRLCHIPDVAIITTIRGNERPSGPAWHPLPPLNPLDSASARQTFLAIAPQHKDDPNLDTLLNVLEGLPLAINLMATTAAIYPSLEVVVKRWHEERAAMLARGPAHRLTNLQVSIALSLNSPRMTSRARDLIALIALLPDGILLTDLPFIFPDQPHAAADPLRKTALVQEVNQRLRILAPIRECVVSLLPPPPTGPQPLETHFLWLAQLGLNLGGEGGAATAERIRVDLANIEAVIVRALNHRPEDAIDAAAALSNFFRLTGYGSSEFLKAPLDAALAIGDIPRQASCVQSLGLIALARSDFDVAKSRYQEALVLFRQTGDIRSQGICIKNLGHIALSRSEHDAARRLFDQAIPLLHGVGALVREADCILGLAYIDVDQRSLWAAGARCEHALNLYCRHGEFLGQANCIYCLGNIAFELADYGVALRRYEDALPVYRRVGDVRGEANCLEGLGDIDMSRNDFPAARLHYEQARSLHCRVGDILGEGNCTRHLGEIALAMGQITDARKAFQQALEKYTRVPEPLSIGRAHYCIARVATTPTETCHHARAAEILWKQGGRHDWVRQIRKEFPSCFPDS